VPRGSGGRKGIDGFVAGAAQAKEFVHGLVGSALGPIAQAVDFGGVGIGGEGVAGKGDLFPDGRDVAQSGAPDFGFKPAIAAKHPVAVDKNIDEGALDGGSRVVPGVEVVNEAIEIGLAFVPDDGTRGVDADLESVHARPSLALDGTRTSGLFGIDAIGFDVALP